MQSRFYTPFLIIPHYDVWMALLVFSWSFYFNFSGFSDLAIGIACLFGFKLKSNFNHPFFSRNIRTFWANWHMSLTRFAQRNVFIPLGGMRKRTQYVAIVGTMIVIALWHGLSFGFVLFGLYHSFGLCIHRFCENYSTQMRKDVVETRGVVAA